MDLNAIVTTEMLQNHDWKIIQEGPGQSFKLKKEQFIMWFIPSNHNIAIYNKAITEECQVVFRGKVITQEQLLIITTLVQK